MRTVFIGFVLFFLFSCSEVKRVERHGTVQESLKSFIFDFNNKKIDSIFSTLPSHHKDNFTAAIDLIDNQMHPEFYSNFQSMIESCSLLVSTKKDFILHSDLILRALDVDQRKILERNWEALNKFLKILLESKFDDSSYDSMVDFGNVFLIALIKVIPEMQLPSPFGDFLSYGISEGTIHSEIQKGLIADSKMELVSFNRKTYLYSGFRWVLVEKRWLPESFLNTYKNHFGNYLDSISKMSKFRVRKKIHEWVYLLATLDRAFSRLSQAQSQQAFNDTCHHMGGVVVLRLLQLNSI